jgi:predicted PurR-regulated permease PerM
MNQTSEYNLDKVVKSIIFISILFSIIWFVRYISDVLLPFIIALILAYLINPFVLLFKNKLKIKNRIFSIVLSLLSIIILLSIIVSLAIPKIIKDTKYFVTLLNKFINDSNIKSRITEYIPDNIIEKINSFIKNGEILNYLNVNNVNQAINIFTNKIVPIISNIFSNSVNIVFSSFTIIITFLYFIFLLIEYEDIQNNWKKLIPLKYRDKFVKVTEDVISAMNKYFKAQFQIAFLIGILFSIGFILIGLPMGLIMGLSIGLMNIIPYMQLLGIFPVIFLSLMYSLETGKSFWWILFLVLLVFIIVQAIQDIYIYPRIMSNVTGLNSSIILLSLAIWSKILGFLGLIIAVPLTYIIINYYKKYLEFQELDLQGESSNIQ